MDNLTNGMLQPLENGMRKAFEYAGEKINDCIMALGSFLDRMTEGIKGMGKSALINVEGLGSKLNPMNWVRQNTDPSPTPAAPPKLGRSAHFHEIGSPTIEKPPIELPQQTMSRHQGALSEFKGLVGGGNIGISLPDSQLVSAPSCPHFGNSFGGYAYAR